MNPDVIVIGAGLSGLACALTLQERGLAPLVLEASDGIGGRVRTDQHQGFLLDRGFQVLQTWYPEARRWLDYGPLDLRPFYPGALVRHGGRFHRVSDVWRRPWRLPEMLLSPIGTLGDKLRLLGLRQRCLRGSIADLYARPETTALARLKDLGFSTRMLDRFFKPFFSGVFFDPELAVSSRSFEFLFRAFALGDTALPARGMGEIPAQLAARLTGDWLRLGCRVTGLEQGQAVLDSGERLDARALVIATDPWAAARLLGQAANAPHAGDRQHPPSDQGQWVPAAGAGQTEAEAEAEAGIRPADANPQQAKAGTPLTEATIPRAQAGTPLTEAGPPPARGTTCCYFAADAPPFAGPYLVLNGEGRGRINSVQCPSNLSEHYAPTGKALITVNCHGIEADPDRLEATIRRELGDWFGPPVATWERLAIYPIPQALPAQPPPVADPASVPQRLAEWLWVCGEYRAAPSIHWTLHSGRRAGEDIAHALGGG